MWIELLRDYRGIKINDELWPKGTYEVPDDLGNYLIGKGYARAANAPLPGVDTPAAPDGIAVHNQAVKDLGLPSRLKVQPIPTVDTEVDTPDELVDAKQASPADTLTRDQLLKLASGHDIEVEGTGKDGHITKQDLLDALGHLD